MTDFNTIIYELLLTVELVFIVLINNIQIRAFFMLLIIFTVLEWLYYETVSGIVCTPVYRYIIKSLIRKQ